MPKSSSVKLKKSFKKKTGLREAMLKRLDSARLRFINDEVYSGKKDVLKSKATFSAYHESFKQQQKLWEANPVDIIIKDLKSLYLKSGNQSEFIVADLGCGDAKISQAMDETRAKVISIDFVAVNSRVTVGDMSHTKLPNSSVDIVVFCLSLMASKCSDYILEARRILKPKGRLFIAEVTSRIPNIQKFISVLKEYGFALYSKTHVSEEYFTYFKFNRINKISNKRSDVELLPCKYKKR